MTQDEIIEMAKEAGMEVHGGKRQIRVGLDVFTGDDTTNQVVAFAKLVAAKEREACAKVCETRLGPTATYFYGNVYAQAIRARGEA
jgi:hypothetical protein